MILHDNITQNTPEWHKVRLGLPTASAFDQLITPVKGDPSASADPYENRLVAERITGDPIDDFGGTQWTERGHELEPEAVAYYEMIKGIDVTHGCFATDDAGTYGASPDCFAGDDGLLEIKCLAPHTHVGMLLNPKADRKHYPQLQGQLLVTNKEWVDILFYHPKLPKLIIRVERDIEYISKLRTAIDSCLANVEAKMKQIKG